LEILLGSWPLLIFVLALMFRKELHHLFAALLSFADSVAELRVKVKEVELTAEKRSWLAERISALKETQVKEIVGANRQEGEAMKRLEEFVSDARHAKDLSVFLSLFGNTDMIVARQGSPYDNAVSKLVEVGLVECHRVFQPPLSRRPVLEYRLSDLGYFLKTAWRSKAREDRE
jgi:hypothetical protein